MARQKYICVTNLDEEIEEIFIFPMWVDHDCFLEAVGAIRSQTWGNWTRGHREIVSAGFVDKNLNCHGKSETLQVESRGDVDTKLLKSLF